jgi:hypothetical protein
MRYYCLHSATSYRPKVIASTSTRQRSLPRERSDQQADSALNYRIAVTADKNIPASRTVKTEFAGNIMEARDTNLSGDTWNKTAATNLWKDTTEASGEIRNLQKRFGYVTGMRV